MDHGDDLETRVSKLEGYHEELGCLSFLLFVVAMLTFFIPQVRAGVKEVLKQLILSILK